MDVTPHKSTNELVARIDEVMRVRKLSAREWSLAAGLSDGYVKGARLRASEHPEYVLPERGTEALARAASVRVEWLRFGRGPRDAEEGGAEAVEAAPRRALRLVQHAKPVEIAILRAYLNGRGDHSEEDVLSALAFARASDAKLPENEEAAIHAMERLITAASRLRRDGQPVTADNIAWSLAMNDEGLAQLRALGAEPPTEPVRIPRKS